MLSSFLRSTRTPKPVLDVKQSSRHISALCVNTSRAQTKIHFTAQNVVSAGRWNDIHCEIARFSICWMMFLFSKSVRGYLACFGIKCYRMNGKKSLASASGQEQRLIREIQAVIDTHMKFTTAILFLLRLYEIALKKYWARLNISFCSLIGIRIPFCRSNRVEI